MNTSVDIAPTRGPWALAYSEHFSTLSEARQRERQIKAWKSHRLVQQLIDGSVD
jgi:predicted GIY-YIG superfamily endonuclease